AESTGGGIGHGTLQPLDWGNRLVLAGTRLPGNSYDWHHQPASHGHGLAKGFTRTDPGAFYRRFPGQETAMTNDPNDPARTEPSGTTPEGGRPASDIYVEPVETRSSPLPLIIGILVALALAYFVLSRFMESGSSK